MNITFLDLDDIQNPLLGAGQAHATFEVGRRLVHMGHTVTSVCSKYPGCYDRVEGGITFKHVGISTRNIQLNNLFYILSMPFVVPHLHADIIIECFTAPISTLFSPLFTRIPVVALPSMFNASEFSKKYHLPFTWIERFGLKFYKYIMPYSTTDRDKALQLNPNIECQIIPQGVGDEYFGVKAKKPKHLLFLSRLDIAQKGIDLLIHAYALVHKQIGYPLVIAGHGPDEEKVKNLIAEAGLKDNIRLAGSTYGKKKFDLIAEALFTVFPSRHDEMCLWTLESLASGLPIVGFAIPESGWLSPRVSVLTKPFDTTAYAKALLRTSQAASLARMRVESKIFAKQYTWKNTVTKIEKYLTYILEKEHRTI